MTTTRNLIYCALLLATLLPVSTQAAPVQSTRLTSCVNSDNDITCNNKMEVSLALSHGLPVMVEAAYISTLDQRTGGEGQQLETPIQIIMTKSLPTWRYRLRYLHSVDYAPFEELVKVANPRPGVSACADGAAAAAPTCGWQLDGAGQRIADSQGFCSNRDLADLKLDPEAVPLMRGEELTGRSTLADFFAIAHCLKMSGMSYRGYEIDLPVRDYTVSTKVYQGTTMINAYNLTPGAPMFLDRFSAHPILAELTGEKPHPPPDLSGYILYIPSAPADDPKVVSWQDNMLLVPRSLVSSDGGECDKVGTGYGTFRRQRSLADATKAGACLGNQLRQLLQADQARLLANPAAETEHLVKNKRLFRGSRVEQNVAALVLPSPEVAYTTVDLEMDPAQLGIIENEAMAWIKAASVADFATFSRQGELKAVIDNIGVVDASYQVTVHKCTAGIEPGTAQGVTIKSKTETALSFSLRSSVVGDHTCDVTLTSATGKHIDEVTVYFTTGAADGSPPGSYLPNNDSRIRAVTP